MSYTMVLAEHRDTIISEVTWELIATAQQLDWPVIVVVIGSNAEQLAEALKTANGIEHVAAIVTESAEFDSDTYRTATAQLIGQYQPATILAGHTAQSMSYLPASAAKAKYTLVSDVCSLAKQESSITATRPFYAGKLMGEVVCNAAQSAFMVRPGSAEPVERNANAPVETSSLEIAVSRTEHQGFEAQPADDSNLEGAAFILSVGRGIGEEDELERFYELSDKLGATLAASRPIVDAGWISRSRQVGQSGKTVSPKVYLAMGISGAAQHLAGIKKAETVIAVNTDAEAAIFGVADYGCVCDLHDLADELDKLISA